MRISTLVFCIVGSVFMSAATTGAQQANGSMLFGSWRARASTAAEESLTFDEAGHVLLVRSGLARAYTIKSDAAAKDPTSFRLALLDPRGRTDSLTVLVRGRLEMDVTRLTHPRAAGDTLVRYVRANPQVSRELRARLDQALHP
jgi:hypothetical protein